jgi:hypothetical protein
MPKSKRNNQATIKAAVENKLVDLLERRAEQAEPSKSDIQILTLGVKYLAVAAKLDEADFGKDLPGLDEE